LIVPTGVARSFDDYVAEHEPECTQDDLAMARYLERSGVDTRLSVPNLVEHSETTSLVGNDFMGRRLATCYADSGLHGHRWDKRVFWPQKVRFFLRSDRTCAVPDHRWQAALGLAHPNRSPAAGAV